MFCAYTLLKTEIGKKVIISRSLEISHNLTILLFAGVMGFLAREIRTIMRSAKIGPVHAGLKARKKERNRGGNSRLSETEIAPLPPLYHPFQLSLSLFVLVGGFALIIPGNKFRRPPPFLPPLLPTHGRDPLIDSSSVSPSGFICPCLPKSPNTLRSS